MKVLFIENVENVGKRGDIKEVKNGLARNFLLPQKLALRATNSNIKTWEVRLNALKLKDAKVLEDAQAIADSLNNVAITIMVKAGEEDKLFGSVTSQNIADSVNKNGFNIDKKDVQLKEPIKELGNYNIGVKVHSEVTANIILDIVREEEPDS
ncbi:MAG: 50S ribosomal protein L9 [Thermodesulfobacteriota bacterium]